MTLSEFKAWLDGFEAAIAGEAPTAEQWATIKRKLAAVSDVKMPTYRDLATWP